MEDIKSNERSLFFIYDPQCRKLISRIRLNFNHLDEQKFRHNFKKCVTHMCACGLETESTQHFFLSCYFYHVERLELLNSIYNRLNYK